MPQDRNNVAPRFGVSYDVTGTGRTILRGSYGLFYDNMIMIVENSARVVTGRADGARTFVAPAPLASSAWKAPGHRLSEAEAIALVGPCASAVSAPNPSLKASFAHQASAGVDHELRRDVSPAVDAVYVRGFNLPGTLDYNPTLPSSLGAGRRPNDLPCARNPAAPCVNGGRPGSSSSIIQPTPYGETWYKGITIGLKKRLSRGNQFMASYTLSKAEDSSTDFQTTFIAQNNGRGRNPDDRLGLPLGFDPRSERGLATQDQRHRFVLSGVYQAPWRLQLSGIVTAASGRPFTPLAGADLNGDGNGGQFPPDRARRSPADESTSVARNSETTAAQATVDIRVSRPVPLNRKGRPRSNFRSLQPVQPCQFLRRHEPVVVRHLWIRCVSLESAARVRPLHADAAAKTGAARSPTDLLDRSESRHMLMRECVRMPDIPSRETLSALKQAADAVLP